MSGSLTTIKAQNPITASGGNAYGSKGTVTYSVEQVVYTTNSRANSSVAQGVQQLYEISFPTGSEEERAINLLISTL